MKMASLEYRQCEGIVKYSPQFEQCDDIIQLDILSDWINDLQEKYEAIHEKAFAKFNNEMKG